MLIHIPWHITREFIQAHRDYNFLYSTNVFNSSPNQGQAYHAQREPNCYGIPVRYRFCRSNLNSYFNDNDSNTRQIIINAINKVPTDKPIIPFHGMGTGNSRMKELAPKLLAWMNEQVTVITYPRIEWIYR